MKSKDLFQKTAINKVLKWSISIEENILTYTWGYVGSCNIQTQIEEVKEANRPGTLSYKTPQEQAQILFDRNIKERIKFGYKETEEEAERSNVSLDFTFDPFPMGFAPAKPISKKPCDENIEDSLNKKLRLINANGRLVAQRKANGIRAYYITRPNKQSENLMEEDLNNNLLFSRKMKDISEHFLYLKTHLDSLNIPEYTILDIEVTLGGGYTDEQFRIVSSMTPNTSPSESMGIYKKWLSKYPEASIVAVIHDVIFDSGENIYNKPYEYRYEKCKHYAQISLNKSNNTKVRLETPEIYKDFSSALNDMKNGKWEGLVIKDLDAGSEFWLNGKPKRPQGCWKWKNTKEEDCVILDVIPEKGNDNLVGALVLGQYLNGELIYCGQAGSGLTDLTSEEAWGWINKVITIIYDERMPKNSNGEYCFRNPRLGDLHPDKTPEECIFIEDEE